MEISKVAQGRAHSVQLENRQANPAEQLDKVQGGKEYTVLSKEEAQKAVDGLNNIMTASNSHLKFQFHDQLKEYYVSIVDENTQEVIKEIPPKKLLDMVAIMWEQIGLIVDKKI